MSKRKGTEILCAVCGKGAQWDTTESTKTGVLVYLRHSNPFRKIEREGKSVYVHEVCK